MQEGGSTEQVKKQGQNCRASCPKQSIVHAVLSAARRSAEAQDPKEQDLSQ